MDRTARVLPASTVSGAQLFDGRTPAGWESESDPTSLAAIDIVPQLAGTALRLRYGLSGGAVSGQYAGIAVATPAGVAPHDRVTLSIRAEHPMRISVQARALVQGAPERWQRSVFVDETERAVTIFFNDMAPVGAVHSSRPPLDSVRNVMLIVDTTHAKPGSSGRLWVTGVTLEP